MYNANYTDAVYDTGDRNTGEGKNNPCTYDDCNGKHTAEHNDCGSDAHNLHFCCCYQYYPDCDYFMSSIIIAL